MTSDPLITIIAGASGTGDGTVTMSVPSNVAGVNVPTPDRFPSFSLANFALFVWQYGCQFTLSGPGATVGAPASDAFTQVDTRDGCAWDTQDVPAWATATDGTGAGRSEIVVSANATGADRTQAMFIAGNAFQLTQLSNALRRGRRRGHGGHSPVVACGGLDCHGSHRGTLVLRNGSGGERVDIENDGQHRGHTVGRRNADAGVSQSAAGLFHCPCYRGGALPDYSAGEHGRGVSAANGGNDAVRQLVLHRRGLQDVRCFAIRPTALSMLS